MKTKKLIEIFSNETIKITTREGYENDSKSIIVHAKAFNKQTGQVHEKNAGWLSKTLALHGFSKTPEYIYSKACEEIFLNQDIIKANLVAIGRKMEDVNKSGLGVTSKIAHPLTAAEVYNVRKIHRKNAPEGTDH